MKAILLALLGVVSAYATPTGPVRVLYLDPEGKEQTAVGPLHDAMRDLGRDAIWFDYAKEALPAENYDLVVKCGSDLSRETILSNLSAERKADYEAFLKQREPEQREKHPQVANYEKRPEPLTLQLPMSVKGSMQRTQVPADCELKLFAAEPDIAKPIAFAWDERGRCWVVETRDYPHGISENGEGQDSVKICEDTDGDGKADKFTVFADKLNLPTGIVFARKGIIVAAPPQFIYLEDTNGDDKADKREVIMDCWGIRDTHAQASNLHYGFDNWIYGCVGYSGIEGYVGGKKHQFAMGTYRFKPDGSALEFLHQFTNNSWGHSYNDAGDQFGGTANGAPIFFGGIPATAFPEGSRGMTSKKINVVDTCHTITPNFRQVDVFGGYTAAAGTNFIYSDALPKRFQSMAMVCEPTMKVVSLMDVQPDGAATRRSMPSTSTPAAMNGTAPCMPRSAPTARFGWPISKTSSSSTTRPPAKNAAASWRRLVWAVRMRMNCGITAAGAFTGLWRRERIRSQKSHLSAQQRSFLDSVPNAFWWLILRQEVLTNS